MSDNVVPWPGPRAEEGGADGFHSGPVAHWPNLDDLLDSLPERFREPARRLAAELLSSTTASGGEPPDSDRLPPVSWSDALEPREAWAIAESFRRAIDAAPTESDSGRRRPHAVRGAAGLHLALDRALLNAAVAAARRTEKSHRRLLEDVSHDIRSPLNSILFLADALCDGRSGPLNEVQARQLRVLYTAAVTLVKMVNDLIDYARLGDRERIHVTRVSFSVESVLTDVRSLLGPLVSHRDVSLQTAIETEGLRSGDPQVLSRVLLNLVSNAVQAVDEGGSVRLRVDETDRGDLRAEISDDRIGTDVGQLRALISEAEADRLPGQTRGWTHGLGLSICARLVKAAGGRISVGSRPGEGTVFTVELPFQHL